MSLRGFNSILTQGPASLSEVKQESTRKRRQFRGNFMIVIMKVYIQSVSKLNSKLTTDLWVVSCASRDILLSGTKVSRCETATDWTRINGTHFPFQQLHVINFSKQLGKTNFKSFPRACVIVGINLNWETWSKSDRLLYWCWKVSCRILGSLCHPLIMFQCIS